MPSFGVTLMKWCFVVIYHGTIRKNHLTPGKTDVSPKKGLFNRKYIFQPLIFRVKNNVSFPGSKQIQGNGNFFVEKQEPGWPLSKEFREKSARHACDGDS